MAQDNLIVVPKDYETIVILDAGSGETMTSINDPIDYSGIQSTAIDAQSVYFVQDEYLSVHNIDDGVRRWKNILGIGDDVFVNTQRDEFYLVGLFGNPIGKFFDVILLKDTLLIWQDIADKMPLIRLDGRRKTNDE